MNGRIYFNPKEQEIMDVLRDMKFHCVYSEVKQKDDRSRISAIRKKLRERNYDIISERCHFHQHESRILMRKIIKLQSVLTTFSYIAPIVSYKD